MLKQYSIIDNALQLGGKIKRVVDLSTGEILMDGLCLVTSKTEGLPIGGAPSPMRAGVPIGEAGGLSMSQNSPFSKSGYLKIYKNGGLIKSGLKKIENVDQKGGGIRTKIFEFSKGSRWRFMQKIGMIDKTTLPVFVTLTYPDDYANTKEDWARHMDNLGKRFARRGWGAIVRKEFARRQSGSNAGKIVPHFHLLVWGTSYYEIFHYIKWAWFKIVKSGDRRHLEAGTRVEMLRSWRGVISYVSKYMAKLNEEDLLKEYPDGVGRFWSVINESVIPWAEMIIESATDKQVYDLFRLMRRYTRAKRVRSSFRSMTILCNHPEQWMRLLE